MNQFNRDEKSIGDSIAIITNDPKIPFKFAIKIKWYKALVLFYFDNPFKQDAAMKELERYISLGAYAAEERG